MSMQVECATCKQSDLDLMRCAGCCDVFYCSPECQRKHWTEDHKVKCKGKVKLGKSQMDKENQLNLANLSITSVKNKKEEDTDADIPEKPTIRDEHTRCIETMMEKGETACGKCGGNTSFNSCGKCRGNTSFNACGKCGGNTSFNACANMIYCSRECQKQEWKRHKKDCSLKDDTGFLDFTAFLRLTEIYRKETKSIKTFKEAVSVANILFHGKWEIIDDLRGVSSDSKMNIQKKVFVGSIKRMHPIHFHQHGFYIQDRRGGETIVMFYLDNDDPAPYFHWNDLYPGRFICIICPIFRNLRDKSRGFRIKDPSEICLLKL